MDLILWRHAEAEDAIHDMSRRLSAKGAKQAEKMAAFLRQRLPQNTHILCSPAIRTQQTAQALSKNFTTDPNIAPGASPLAVLQAAAWVEGEGCILIVGHQPYLGEIAAVLMTGEPKYWSIKKGAVWWFNRRDHGGESDTTLRLVMAPDML